MCAQAFPEGTAFSARSQCLFAEKSSLPYFLGLMNSTTLDYLFKAALGRTDFPEFIVGVLRNLPQPNPSADIRAKISSLALQAATISRKSAAFDEVDRMFVGPRLVLFRDAKTLSEAAQACLSTEDRWLGEIEGYQARLDELVANAYGLSKDATFEVSNSTSSTRASEEDALDVEQQLNNDEDDDSTESSEPRDLSTLGRQLFSWLVGCAFGRWFKDISLADMETQPDVDLFGPQPTTPLAATRGDNERWHAYTKEILVDDPGHNKDIVGIVTELIGNIWNAKGESIESELCSLLQCKDLRSFLYKGNGFLESHFKQYSKSGRKSPIYWPLSTPTFSYTLWIYYPRLTSQTLYTAVNDFVEPKLKQVGADVTALRNKGHARTRDDEKQFEALQTFELELIELRDTLLQIAPTYRPNHDDGVQITAAPLWQLFRHKPWQKILKDTWAKLEKGEYDWAHLAMVYWPDRVREKCKTDKSLAIAHDLEHLYVPPEPKAPKSRARKKASEA